jgi:hypothetical protein
MHLIYHSLLSAGTELTCGIQYALSEIKRTCPNQTKCDKNYSGRCTGRIPDAVAPGDLDRKLGGHQNILDLVKVKIPARAGNVTPISWLFSLKASVSHILLCLSTYLNFFCCCTICY